MLQPTTTIYDAYIENQPGWDGEGLYADLETAKRYSAAEYVLEAWGTDSTGPLTWRFEHGFWDLLDDGQATGVIVAPREVVGTQPDEQPAAEPDGGWARHAVELLTAVVDPKCNSDSYGNCATHGVLVLEAGAQCPHALARAFLAGSRAHLGAMAAEQDGGTRAAAACCLAAEMFEHDADCETRDADGSAS